LVNQAVCSNVRRLVNRSWNASLIHKGKRGRQSHRAEDTHTGLPHPAQVPRTVSTCSIISSCICRLLYCFDRCCCFYKCSENERVSNECSFISVFTILHIVAYILCSNNYSVYYYSVYFILHCFNPACMSV